MMLIHKKLSYFLPCYKTIPNPPSYLHRCLLPFSTTLSQNPTRQTSFVVNYLINSCGFSLGEATKASKYLKTLNSSEQPDSVIEFLKQQGFTETHIRGLISWLPGLLNAKVEKTLEPNIRALHDIGFSGSKLMEIIISNPHALVLQSVVPRIEFWRTLLGDEEYLLKAFKNNRDLIKYDISKSIAPKICLLKEYGFSDRSIAMILLHIRSFISRGIDSIEVLVKRTKELGFVPGSKKFLDGLIVVSYLPNATFQGKIELLKNYGWSEYEFFSAFKMAPTFARLSKKNIQAKMDFLVEKAGCKLSYIALRSVILTYSLEKRLMPRHYVLQNLSLKGLIREKLDLCSVMKISEKKFVGRFILPYNKEAPELHETYIAACASKIPFSSHDIKEKLNHL